jgi:hypothetical protein
VRKRIAIAVLAIIGVGVLAYVVSQPKKGSVEWHKREYRGVRIQMARIMRLHQPGLSDHLRRIYQRVSRRAVPMTSPQENVDAYEQLAEKMSLHEQALVDAGFLAKCDIQVHPTDWVGVWWSLVHSRKAIDDYVSGRLAFGDSNFLIAVTGPSNALPKWEGLIRKARVPPRQETIAF